MVGVGVAAVAYTGDSVWAHYQMVAGRWFHGKGEAVVPRGFLTATGTHLGDTVTLAGNGQRTQVRLVGEAMSVQNDGLLVLTGTASVTGLATTTDQRELAGRFAVQLTPGTSPIPYCRSLNAALASVNGSAEPRQTRVNTTIVAVDTLTGTFVLLLVGVARLGVFNTVVLDTRDRIHDLGVMKALGMAPRQTIAMVLTSITAIGLLAGTVGVPAGIALHSWILPKMADAAGTGFPAADLAVYNVAKLIPLLLGGLIIAVAGAIVPAGWAARAHTAVALRAE